MFVIDERGGGVVPPGSSCAPGIDNPYGNGGAHAFDVSDPANVRYAKTPTGEQRFIAAYYSQGIKIVDYFVDGQATSSTARRRPSRCRTRTPGRLRTSRSSRTL